MADAMSYWLTGLPTTLAAFVAIIGSAAVSILALLLIHPIVPHGLRRIHNDVAGFTLAIVGVVYAVLLAFIAVAVWQGFQQADMIVQTEANLVGNLYRDTIALPDPLASKLRHTLYVYAETVVQDEWSALAAGRVEEDSGWQLLDTFHADLAQFHTESLSTSAVQTEMLQQLNALYDARRGRFHTAANTLPAVLWWNLLAGAAILIVFSCLFGVPNLVMHAAMVGLLGASIGLILLLIVLLKDPFRGDNHVSVEPFDRLVHAVETGSFPHK